MKVIMDYTVPLHIMLQLTIDFEAPVRPAGCPTG